MSLLLVPYLLFVLAIVVLGFLAIPLAALSLVVTGASHAKAAADRQRAVNLRLRAGDADRVTTTSLLRDHFAVGRITPAELEDRVGDAFAARTPADLLRLLSDLPPAPALVAARRVRPWLLAAALYNLAWGSAVALAGPSVAWRCVGMLVLVWAPAYWWAGRDPLRHAHVVALGLLGKVLGPLGFVVCAATGALPLSFGFVVLANDVIWWPAFARFVRAAARAAGGWAPFVGGASATGSTLQSVP